MQEDMPYLHTALASASPELQQACLFPSYQQLAVFAEQHQHLDLSDALELFADRCALACMHLIAQLFWEAWGRESQRARSPSRGWPKVGIQSAHAKWVLGPAVSMTLTFCTGHVSRPQVY